MTPRLLRWIAAVESAIALVLVIFVVKPRIDCRGPSCALLNPEHVMIRFLILLVAGLSALALIILARIKDRE